MSSLSSSSTTAKHVAARCLAAVLCAAALLHGRALGAEPPKIVLTLDRRQGPNWRAVDVRTVFEPSDQLRFRISATFDGYIYAINHGTSGRTVLLFPAEDAGRGNRIQSGNSYAIPANEGHFVVSGPPGYDTVYWLVTDVELTKTQESDLLSLPAAASNPALSPRCDDKLFRARSICMDVSAGLRPVVPSAMARPWPAIASSSSRELSFSRDKHDSIVQLKAAPGPPVVYALRIAHR